MGAFGPLKERIVNIARHMWRVQLLGPVKVSLSRVRIAYRCWLGVETFFQLFKISQNKLKLDIRFFFDTLNPNCILVDLIFHFWLGHFFVSNYFE